MHVDEDLNLFVEATSSSRCPRVKSARSANRAAWWRQDLARTANYLRVKARSDDELAAVERAYEQAMAEGPDFIHHRGRSVFQAAAKVGIDRNAFFRIMNAIEAIERGVYRTGRRKGTQGIRRAVPKVLKVLLGLALKYGEVRPSLDGLARMAGVCKVAVVAANKFLELYGFITKTRRIKRIQTPLGPKVVQDTNLYTIHEPRGLGAIAVRVFGHKSEFRTRSPSSRDFHSSNHTRRNSAPREVPDGVFAAYEDETARAGAS